MKEIDIFYNTYNARHLNPREVAETFIWSDSFGKLIQNNHSVILGARGCGKTTLMKMLTLPALHSWRGPKSENILNNIEFYSIYISTDIYWNVKNQTYSSQLEKFGEFSKVISEFSVNSNVFKALCDTFKNVINLELNDLDEEKEFELSKILIEAWKLKSAIPKLDYIIDAINLRIDNVNQIIQGLIFNFRSEGDLPKDDYFSLTFESSIEYIIPIFERIYGIKGKKKWALCFDELEFAPDWLQQKLFVSLRSRTQFLLYKLSASPILSNELEKLLTKDYGPTAGNDFQIIKMWGSQQTETFSLELIESILKKKYPNCSASEFFGSNNIYNKSPNSYDLNSDFYNQELALLKKDDSFREFLIEYKIDPELPVPISDAQKDTIFRKIKPIVYFRNFYIRHNKRTEQGFNHDLRSRKTGDLYFGIEVLKKVCDGNPRWLISLITSILSRANDSGADKRVQYDELLLTSRRFCNVIENIPIGHNSALNFKQVLEKIGDYFNNQILGPFFSMDPKGTFVVDLDKSPLSNNIIEILEKGVSQGAFVLLDSKDEVFDFQIRGKRFKLSYLLCVLHKLPLRKYPSDNLSDILLLKKEGRNTGRHSNQLTIFNK
ncbi:hypothetical protein [Runella sp.]|uniref:ORC-CDC6 family AAA ATPase n=1 Tax=Runella sp. TaxID=1960881 RepID=UPI003D098B20